MLLVLDKANMEAIEEGLSGLGVLVKYERKQRPPEHLPTTGRH